MTLTTTRKNTNPRARAKTALSLSAAVTLLVTGAALYAGPLNPPVGPVTSTNKTLTEVEPRIAINTTNTPGDGDSLFKITQRGSYYLTGNITGVAAKSGIEIASDDVTIDLQGFTLTGVAGSLDGITRDSTPRGGITLLNGSVVGWGLTGVDLVFTNSAGSRGFRFDGIRSRSNGANGFNLGDGAILVHCEAGQNGDDGFSSANHVSFDRCVATGNTGSGFTDGFGCSYTGCISRANSGHGFITSGNSTFANCSGSLNGGNGFRAFRSILTNCDSSFNGEWGFMLTSGGTIQSCSANTNTSGGIQTGRASLILHNQVVDGSTGILAGNDNRIEGNNVNSSSIGLSATGAGNIIIRNTCAGNSTGWAIVANNVVGPILDRRAPGNAAITGFNGPDSTGSTHPNANFSY